MAATTGPYAGPGAPPAGADQSAYRALVAELQQFVKRMDRYERQGWPVRTQVSTLLPLRDAARAVLHPTTSPGRAEH